MINHIWTVICSDAVIDSRTNNVSIHNVLEQINIVGEPKQESGIPLNHAVITFWERLENDPPWKGVMRLSFITPSGNETITIESSVNLVEHKRQRHIGNIQGLPTMEAGRHVYRVELRNENESKWTFICEIPLELKFIQPNHMSDLADNP